MIQMAKKEEVEVVEVVEVVEEKPAKRARRTRAQMAADAGAAEERSRKDPVEETPVEEAQGEGETPKQKRQPRKLRDAGESAPRKVVSGAAALRKEAEKLAALAALAEERAARAEIKEALTTSAQGVKDLENYLKELDKEMAKTQALLTKAAEKHEKLVAKHAVSE
jgi:hypothetical protein